MRTSEIRTMAGWSVLVFILVSVLAGGTACNKSSSSAPTTPTSSQPRLNALDINGSAALRTGFFSDCTLTATFSNGMSQAVVPTWSTGDPAIATVDSNGRVTGRTHGPMTFSATYQGQTATKVVSIVNDHGGA